MKWSRPFWTHCDHLGIPVSLEKTEWASELVVFLGILLDGRNLILAVPEEKKQIAINLLKDLVGRRKTTVKDLQKLCGYLNFLCRAIQPGRTFTRRMYSKFSQVIHFSGITPRNSYEYKLKQHHHVNLDSEFKLDCRVWDWLPGKWTTPDGGGIIQW